LWRRAYVVAPARQREAMHLCGMAHMGCSPEDYGHPDT
jgi:hypothetical protein